MPLTLSAGIEAEVEAAETSVIDLFEIDLGAGFKKFWSTTNVSFDWVSTQFPQHFEARILEVSNRKWTLGFDDDTINLRISNADGKISQIAKGFGIDIFEGARVLHHRLFPSIKEIYKDYWCGEGLPLVWTEGEVSWDITFGVGNFRQKFGRKLEFNCPHVFAGGLGSDCPYDPQGIQGIPEAKILVTATSGTSIFQINAASGLITASQGWTVFNRTRNAYARITKVVSDTQLNIVALLQGESGSLQFLSGDKLLIGPDFSDCNKTVSACIEREMWGLHSGRSSSSPGVGQNRRHYGGWSATSQQKFGGRLPNPEERFGHGDAKRFSRSSLGNDNLVGMVIPVIVGAYRINDIPSIAMLPAGRFQHGLFILCEGEIFDFALQNVNGKKADDSSPKDLNTLAKVAQNDSFIKWGTWNQDTNVGIDDLFGRNADHLAKGVRRAVGRRIGLGVNSGNTILDFYALGNIGNPHTFNSSTGDGISLHGIAAARIRLDTEEDSFEVMSGNFDISGGLLVRLPAGMNNNAQDGTRFNFIDILGTGAAAGGLVTLKYTRLPNPIQFAYELLRNPRWGAGLPDERIDLPSVITESDYCEEQIASIESSKNVLVGTVFVSSATACGIPTSTWFLSTDIVSSSNSLSGAEVTFNSDNGRTFSALILYNNMVELVDFVDDPGVCGVVGGFPLGAANEIIIDRPFPVGKEPLNDDLVEIRGGGGVGANLARFKANGILADDAPIPDILQDVLDNCNGTFRSTVVNGQGKLEFIIRKKLSPTEIDTVISDGIFTDRGVKRNILRNREDKSTMKVWREDEKSLGNFFTVEFRDKDRDFQESRVAVFNDSAQKKVSALFGEPELRVKVPENLKLILTTNKDQAARLLALRARELSIQNLFCSFETSLKRGMKAQPGDIIAVDSETIAAHFNLSLLTSEVAVGNSFLFRILEKSETSDYRISFECQVHVNPIYEDFATDFTQFFAPDEAQREKNVVPAPVTPIAPVESVIVNTDGSASSVLKVKVTYPNLEV